MGVKNGVRGVGGVRGLYGRGWGCALRTVNRPFRHESKKHTIQRPEGWDGLG